MKDIAIVTVGYKESLTDDEIISFERCLRVFNKRDIFMITPDNIDLYGYEYVINNANKPVTFLKFDANWFKSVNTYSKLLVQKSFYELFLDYKYILIYQLDCYAFKDNLDYFINLDYDYYGAAWTWSNVYKCVGNGGLSLRKISAFIENIGTRKDLDYINSEECNDFIEDLAFCNGFFPLKNICTFDVAEQFSFETTACWRNPSEMNINDFPMGMHGFTKPEFKEQMGYIINRWNELNKKWVFW